jgi:lipopolysaccharide assembly protein A
MSTDPQPARIPAPSPPPPADLPEPETAVSAQQPEAPQQPVQQPVQQPEQQPGQLPLPQHKIKRTRTSGLWVAVASFAVILLLLLIFILQNGAKVDISYMGAHGHLPLGVALLLAAVCGVLLTMLAGAARISQLRTVARRHRRADARRAGTQQRPQQS